MVLTLSKTHRKISKYNFFHITGHEQKDGVRRKNNLIDFGGLSMDLQESLNKSCLKRRSINDQMFIFCCT
jgi:hypothetical protein